MAAMMTQAMKAMKALLKKRKAQKAMKAEKAEMRARRDRRAAEDTLRWETEARRVEAEVAESNARLLALIRNMTELQF